MNEGVKTQVGNAPATRDQLIELRRVTSVEINQLRDSMINMPTDGPDIEIAMMRVTRLQTKLNTVDAQLELSNATMSTKDKAEVDMSNTLGRVDWDADGRTEGNPNKDNGQHGESIRKPNSYNS